MATHELLILMNQSVTVPFPPYLKGTEERGREESRGEGGSSSEGKSREGEERKGEIHVDSRIRGWRGKGDSREGNVG